VTVSDPGRDYLERARTLAPTIAGLADRIEAERRLPAPLADALHEAGLFRMLLPRSLGGAELDPPTFAQVMEEIAKADASTAWVLGQTAGCSMISAYLDHEAAARVFGPPRSVLAWGAGPQGHAVAVDGGYRLTGSWAFASGLHEATWLGAHAPIVGADDTPHRHPDGPPVVRTLLFPIAAATVSDVWNVLGLRGTGSDSYAVKDVFVPRAYTAARDEVSERRETGPLYCFPSGSLYASGFACVSLGIARSLLDAVVALAREKTARGHKHTLRENAVTQSLIAQSDARLNAARTYVLATLHEIRAEAGRTGTSRLASACASGRRRRTPVTRGARSAPSPTTPRAPTRSSPAGRGSGGCAIFMPSRSRCRAATIISRMSGGSCSASILTRRFSKSDVSPGGAMDLDEAMRTTFAAREFSSDPLPDATLAEILDRARFAPSGGNRQGWKVIVVREPATRQAIAKLTEFGAKRYVAQQKNGENPWNTIDPPRVDAATIERTEPLPRLIEPVLKAPVILVICVDLKVVASTEQNLQRVGVISGASIYPFAWSILLAARARGFGGTITTLAVAQEPELKKLLGLPHHVAVAAVMPLGRPVKQLTKLTRKPVSEFAMRERWGGPPLG
jgi:indole-3-acetate monooxygenase